MRIVDFAIIGGGIVGLATASEVLRRHPTARVVLVEKDPVVALHQTGRNSGVIHAGVYYAPNSLKARFCRQGAAATKAFCDTHYLPYETCGKLIVATEEVELARMDALFHRAVANGLTIERLDQDDARRQEPNIRSVGALWSPDTGIVDFAVVARKMADLFVADGGELLTGAQVIGGVENAHGVVLYVGKEEIAAAKAVFCCGLHSDRVARMMGLDPDFRIIPFRGEYFRLVNQSDDLVRTLIYPVPDPERPFLGVHLTRKMEGGFTVGPNAVLAAKREGYRRSDVSLSDLTSTIAWPGFWAMLARNFRPAVDELRSSISQQHYLRKVQRYCPQIKPSDLAPYRSGVRAQAVSSKGKLIDDFHFLKGRHSLHVCNAPSPAATASLPIAAYIVDQLLDAG